MAPAARRAPSARRYHRAGRPGTERGAAAASCCGGSGGAESGEQIVTGAGRAGPRSGPACLLACLPARFSLPSPRGGAGGAARPARRVAMGAGGGHGRHCGAGRAGGCRAVLCCAAAGGCRPAAIPMVTDIDSWDLFQWSFRFQVSSWSTALNVLGLCFSLVCKSTKLREAACVSFLRSGGVYLVWALLGNCAGFGAGMTSAITCFLGPRRSAQA